MSKSTLILSHLDKLNKVIIDLNSINLRIKDENQVLILLCFLPQSIKHLLDNCLYGKDIIYPCMLRRF